MEKKWIQWCVEPTEVMKLWNILSYICAILSIPGEELLWENKKKQNQNIQGVCLILTHFTK